MDKEYYKQLDVKVNELCQQMYPLLVKGKWTAVVIGALAKTTAAVIHCQFKGETQAPFIEFCSILQEMIEKLDKNN